MGTGNKSVAIMGASRGFGRAFSHRIWDDSSDRRLMLMARKAELLAELKEYLNNTKKDVNTRGDLVKFFSCDFSREEGHVLAFQQLEMFHPERIFYFAGGGPYGAFEKMDWKDHMWAWTVTYVFAARVVHWAMQHDVEQVVLVGSAISESQGDPRGASYSAAKHALLGLVRSIHMENPAFDLRLFSPGYMDTDLLPAHAPPRHSEEMKSPLDVADVLWKWSNEEVQDFHFIYK